MAYRLASGKLMKTEERYVNIRFTNPMECITTVTYTCQRTIKAFSSDKLIYTTDWKEFEWRRWQATRHFPSP